MRTFALTFGLAFVGCRQLASVSPSPPQPAPEIVSCTIRGAQRMYPTTYLFSAASGGMMIGRSGGDVLAFEISDIAVGPGARTRARVRAPVSGPAFVLSGFLDLRELDVFTTRDVPIIATHVWIEKGANVRLVRGGDGTRPRIVSPYGAFGDIPALAPCDALTLETSVQSEAPGARRNAPPERLAHLARTGAPLFDENGVKLVDLTSGEGATLELTARRGDLFHVLYVDGVAIDGWMSARDLAPGAGPDCDDCHGSVRDIHDKCPDEPTDEDGCSSSSTSVRASAIRDTEVRFGPEPTSLVIGRLERGAEIVIVNDPRKEAPKGVVRVRPRHGEFEPLGGDFWVDESVLAKE